MTTDVQPEDTASEDTGRTALPPPLAAGYALGNVGLATFMTAPQLLLLYFLTDTLAVPAALGGLLVMIPKIWEVIFDPMVGLVSDRLRGRLGRRWPLMAIGAALFPISFAALFAPPASLDVNGALIWVFAAYVASTSAYALYAIPYATMPAEISRLQKVRTRIVAWRVGFLAFGLMVSGGLAPLIVEAVGGGRPGYAVMGFALAAMAAGALLGSLTAAWKLQDRDLDTGPKLKVGEALKGGLRATLMNPGYRLLWVGFAFQTLAMGAHAAIMPYAVAYQLQASSAVMAQIFVAGGLMQIATMPVWVKIADRIGSARAAVVAVLVYAVAAAANLALGPGDTMLAVCIALVAGFGQAGCYVLPFAMMPGVVQALDPREGRANAGLLTAVWVSGEKLGLALGGAVAGIALGLVGYVAGTDAQSVRTLQAIPFLFSILPAVMLLLSTPFLIGLSRLKKD